MMQESTVSPIPDSRTRVTGNYDYAFTLHRTVFHGDAKKLSNLLKTSELPSLDINQKDVHGNTPLHLAVMLGREDCLQVLLEHEAKIAVKNSQGWTPLAEAVSFGNREIISSLLKYQKKQTREELSKRRPELIQGLECMGNFYMELRWDFQSWIPLVSRILPSDVCKIYKKGCNIRVDTTLVDFNDMKWERGDVSFLFRGKGFSPRMLKSRSFNKSLEASSSSSSSYALIIMDNKQKVFQRIKHQEKEHELEDEVDILMSSDIVSAQINTKHLNFDRVSTGWLFKADKTEAVGSFLADFYAIHGFVVESRKRREHLSEEDLQKNRAIMDSLTKGPELTNGINNSNHDKNNLVLPIATIPRRPSLAPPVQNRRPTWKEYISSPVGQFPILGRTPVSKLSSKNFKATLAMSQDFPLTIDALIDLLEVIAPFKQFKKLREFVEIKLPPGFPVKIEIPILPTVTAKITFQEFMFDDNLADEYFEVPLGYVEDSCRFPDL